MLAIPTVVVFVAATPAAGVNPSPSASPPASTYCPDHPNAPQCAGVSTSDGGFDVTGSTGAGGGTGAGSTGAKPAELPDTYTIYDYAPTCTGNERTDASVLCGAAVNSCLPTGQGIIQYWRWKATVDRRTGQVLDPPGWVPAGEVCLGPGDAGVPPLAAIAGILATDFKKLLVVKAIANVEPRGTTLVNYETGFYTETGKYVLDPVTILGHKVVVTATPKQYDWHFGDGHEAIDAGPGRQGTLNVSHTYAETGSVAPYVVITWSGTFTVDGGTPRDVFGTAQTTGPGTPLQVKQARAELVGG